MAFRAEENRLWQVHDVAPGILFQSTKRAQNLDQFICSIFQLLQKGLQLPEPRAQNALKAPSSWGVFEGLRSNLLRELGKCTYPGPTPVVFRKKKRTICTVAETTCDCFKPPRRSGKLPRDWKERDYKKKKKHFLLIMKTVQ